MPLAREATRGGQAFARVLWFVALCLGAGNVHAANVLADFTGLVAASSPAVVNISTILKPGEASDQDPLDEPGADGNGGLDGDLQKQAPGQGDDLGGNGGTYKPVGDVDTAPDDEVESLGSGFIIASDGYIVTNFHVVKDAERIIVHLSDRRVLDARLVGSDAASDLALLKIKASGLPVAKIGHSSQLQVGQWVFAIGSPFGFDNSVSVGVVSALGRSLPSETYVPFIQTDVPINPGNSGGPLFNLKGEVVGVNSQIYSRTGGFMGLSFAIPVDVAMDVIHQLRTRGHVVRAWLGVLVQDVSLSMVKSFGTDRLAGAFVVEVLPDSPAAKAGLKVGDIIQKVAGHPIVLSSDLPVVVGRTPVHTLVALRILRRGKPLVLRVRLGRLPAKPMLVSASPAATPKLDARLGLAVATLHDARRKALGLDGHHGVLVRDVGPGPAYEAGIRRGDAIVMLDGVDVDTVEQFRHQVARLPAGRNIPVLIQRADGPLFVALKVPPPRAPQ